MIDGKYVLTLLCGNGKCPMAYEPRLQGMSANKLSRRFDGYNAAEAKAKARHAGWLFKGEDVLCPTCSEPYRHKPRYPGGRGI